MPDQFTTFRVVPSFTLLSTFFFFPIYLKLPGVIVKHVKSNRSELFNLAVGHKFNIKHNKGYGILLLLYTLVADFYFAESDFVLSSAYSVLSVCNEGSL